MRLSNQIPEDFSFGPLLAHFGEGSGVEQAFELIWTEIVAGEIDWDEFHESVDTFVDPMKYEHLLDTGMDVVDETIEALIEVRKRQIAERHGQPSPIIQAFADLEAQGVVAHAGKSCCGTCGNLEGHTDMMESGKDAYVYFHFQDIGRLIKEDRTYIGFGINLGKFVDINEFQKLDNQAQEEVYRRLFRDLADTRLIPTFSKYGIGLEWNGDPATRMLLSNCDFFVPLDD